MRRLLLTYVTVLNLIIDTHSACLVYAFLLNLVKSYFLSGAHSSNIAKRGGGCKFIIYFS